MFMHLSCQCPFKRGFEVNANIIIFFFSLEPVHLEMVIHFCPLSLKFPYFQGFWVFFKYGFMAHGSDRVYRRLLLYPRLNVGLLSYPRLYLDFTDSVGEHWDFTGYFALFVGFSVATAILLFDIFPFKFYCL